MTANLPPRDGPGPRSRRADEQPVRRVIIIAATYVEVERERVHLRLTREQTVPVVTVADADRAARLYRGFSNRELVLLSTPMQGRRVMATLRAAGIKPEQGQHFADTASR